MKMRVGLLVTCAATTLVLGTGLRSPALAADKMVTKAPPIVAPIWWYEGYLEVGYRDYLNNPNERDLWKFYEYRDLSPGVFGNFYIAAHRTNPIDIAAWGYNVGYDDQAYGLDFADVGTFYGSLGWDETPHVYYKNAKSTYGGIGTNLLSTPMYPFPPGAATQAFVDANSSIFDIKTRRDTASAKVKWTPNDNLTFSAGYAHTHRHGTQVQNAVTFAPPAGRGGADTRAPIEFAKKVDDVTQTGDFKAEYAGSTPWGTPFNFALGYAFSLYDNDVGCPTVPGTIAPTGASCMTFQNPWIAVNTNVDPLWNRISLEPSNEAHTVSASGGFGLPFHSRYMGTFQHTWMSQDEPFLPSTINPLGLLAAVSRSNLAGDATTTLFNNVLNTQWTKTVKTTLRYRFYDYKSHHGTTTVLGWAENPDTSAGAANEIAHPFNFTKQNASAEVVWRPMRGVNTGAAYEWERRSRDIHGTDVVTLVENVYDIVTNQNAVKVFGDAVWGRSTVRGSLWYGERRYEGDYIRIANNNFAFRTVDVQDRDTTKGQASWAFEATPQIVLTALGGFRNDDYPTNGVTEFGINSYESWNLGGEVAWMMNSRAHFFFSFIHDDGHRETYQRTLPSDLVYDTHDRTNTFIVGGKLVVIPAKLFWHGSFTYTRATSAWQSNCGPGGCSAVLPITFPDIHNTNYRLDTWVKYVFDDTFIKSAGWTGKAFIKARLVWEKNENDSWQSIQQQLGWAIDPGNTTTARAVFLATGNPNYDVVVGSLSFGVKW